MPIIRVDVKQGVGEKGQPSLFTWDLVCLVTSEHTKHLDANGLPKVGTLVKEGMLLIGRRGNSKEFDESKEPSCLELNGLSQEALIRKYSHLYQNLSVYAEHKHCGVVLEARLLTNPDGSQKAVVVIEKQKRTVEDVQSTVDAILAGKCTEQDLVGHARSDFVLIAANAVIALTKLDELSQEAVLALKELAIADQKKVLFGTVTIANLAFAALKWLGTKSSEEEYLKLVESVSSERIEDVENLVSQGPPQLETI